MRFRFALVTLACTLVTAACSKDSTVAPTTSPVGTYALATVNGKSLPQVAARVASGDVEVVSASLVLKTDASYASTYTYRTVTAPITTFTQNISGTWSASGGAVTFYPTGASPSSVSTMQWSGGTLTLVDPNAVIPVTLVFRR